MVTEIAMHEEALEKLEHKHCSTYDWWEVLKEELVSYRHVVRKDD